MAPASAAAPQSTLTSPQPTAPEQGAFAKIFAKPFKLVKEYGPAVVVIWSGLYIVPGIAAFQALYMNDNFGYDVAQALELLPADWRASVVTTVNSYTGADAQATTLSLKPWQTSAALGYAFTELLEPLRFPASLWGARQWKKSREAKRSNALSPGMRI
jgi:hypothetical protein